MTLTYKTNSNYIGTYKGNFTVTFFPFKKKCIYISYYSHFAYEE